MIPSMGSPATQLPPGFRFHPTDEELVAFYLHRKVCGRSGRKIDSIDVIAEIDLYKHEPWELPGLSCLQSKDSEWYFFNPPDKKYPRGSRTNRSTKAGYWKATGKDRKVCSNSRIVGTKKTLVFYKGRAPTGERTDWVMHEYQLVQSEENTDKGFKDFNEALVLCRIMKKTGPGPKSRNQVSSPLDSEEFDFSPPSEGTGRTPAELIMQWSHRREESSNKQQEKTISCQEKTPVMHSAQENTVHAFHDIGRKRLEYSYTEKQINSEGRRRSESGHNHFDSNKNWSAGEQQDDEQASWVCDGDQKKAEMASVHHIAAEAAKSQYHPCSLISNYKIQQSECDTLSCSPHSAAEIQMEMAL